MLTYTPTLAIGGLDTEESEPLKSCLKIHSLFNPLIAEASDAPAGNEHGAARRVRVFPVGDFPYTHFDFCEGSRLDRFADLCK